MCLLSLTIVSAIKAAGIILIVAMLIAPGAIGFLISQTFDKMLTVAIITSVSACFGNIAKLPFGHGNRPSGVIQAILFLMAMIVSKTKRVR